MGTDPLPSPGPHRAAPVSRKLACVAGVVWLASLFGPFHDSSTSIIHVMATVFYACMMAFGEVLPYGPWAAIAYATTPLASIAVAAGRRPGLLVSLTVALALTSPGSWMLLTGGVFSSVADRWGGIAWMVAVALLLVIGCLDPFLRSRQARQHGEDAPAAQ